MMSVLRTGLRRVTETANRFGPGQTLKRRLADARDFWVERSSPSWLSDSHWRGALQEDIWLEVGQEHLAMFEMFARALDRAPAPGVVIEWGCGGGANAVAFAPNAREFIAADISMESVEECLRQIAAVCNTPTQGIHVDIEQPEKAVAGLEELCDTFLCYYVLELTAGPDEALRIIRIAERALVSGGIAVIQVKYHTTELHTRGYKRNYRSHSANMTTFGIDEFWQQAKQCGLTPRLITLVPQNRLDLRYAYYALTKP
jgi:SAM-dependent methyltransferase